MLLLLLILQYLEGSLPQESKYNLVAPTSETAQVGQCIQVLCSVSYPPLRDFPIFGYWFREGAISTRDKAVATNDPEWPVEEETRGRFHLIGDPMKKNCSLNIKNIQKRDSGRYFFWIQGKGSVRYDYKSNMVTVSVKALTQMPDIYIPETLEPEYPVKVICTVPSAFICWTPPIFSWTGAILSSQESSRESIYFSELTITPRSQDHGSNLTCQMTLPEAKVSTERTVQLRITGEQKSSWPLVLTLIRGAFMGTGFLITYGLTYLYYSRNNARVQCCLCPITQASSEEIHYASLNFRRINPRNNLESQNPENQDV
ncbi:LOW QUALITY PROTEIN: sialic acid-binding Ig-like lectin 14 [Macrotis lagotis]|uniref:LOW QUALITY PROTEIN: sialic acid-binding Ig-like lectin 14 n=1 Tax=Macrotis lagotis TaxID=92651 RepID=UPI003D68107E